MVAIEYLNSYIDGSDEKNYRNSHDNAITDIGKDLFCRVFIRLRKLNLLASLSIKFAESLPNLISGKIYSYSFL